MAWSTAIGLGIQAYSAMSANSQARNAQAYQNYFNNRQLDLQNANFALALDQERERKEDNEYRRQIEMLNRSIAADERREQLRQVQEYKEQIMAERRQQIERQIAEDKEAARLSQLRLERILRNEDLAEEERAFAIQQLEQARAVAAGERDEDMRRFLEDRESKKIERDFAMAEYVDSKTRADMERQDDLRMRDQIMASIFGLQNTLQQTQAGLGAVPMIDQISEADINAEFQDRLADYTADVDRGAEKVASINEANLIRGGIDESTTGTDRRGEIAGRLANEYQKARVRAKDDALKYITGMSGAMTNNINDIMKQRTGILSEDASVAGAGIDQLMRLPSVRGTANQVRYASSLPTSIYNRNVSSANNFRAPVPVGTAMFTGMQNLANMADASNFSSAAFMPTGLGSAVVNPLTLNLGNPATYLGNANTIANNLATTAGNMATTANKRAYDASSGFGTAFRDMLDDNSGDIDNFFNRTFKMGEYSPQYTGGNTGQYYYSGY